MCVCVQVILVHVGPALRFILTVLEAEKCLTWLTLTTLMYWSYGISFSPNIISTDKQGMRGNIGVGGGLEHEGGVP